VWWRGEIWDGKNISGRRKKWREKWRWSGSYILGNLIARVGMVILWLISEKIGGKVLNDFVILTIWNSANISSHFFHIFIGYEPEKKSEAYNERNW
jgi:hypothetical protein